MKPTRLVAALLLSSAAALGASQSTAWSRFAADTAAPDTGVDTGGDSPVDTGAADGGGAVDGATGETAAPVDSGAEASADTGEAADTAGEAIPLLSAAQVAGEAGGYNCQTAPVGLSWIGLGVGLVALGRRRR